LGCGKSARRTRGKGRYIYRARPNSIYNDGDAAVIGPVLTRIEGRDGSIQTEAVVEEASGKNSPLHDYFDWDDKSAARKHRLQQARVMIGAIVVEYVAVSEERPPLRAFYSVETPDAGESYVSLEKVLSDDDYRKQVVEKARKEAKAWAERYRAYKEFGKVIKTIDDL